MAQVELHANSNNEGARRRIDVDDFKSVIAEVLDYAIVLLDINGTIMSWNKGAEKIKGYLPEEIIGRNFRIFYSKEDRNSQLPEHLLGIATANGRAVHEGWRIRKDGTRFWGDIAVTAVHNKQGEITGFLKMTRDLTERKKTDDDNSNFVEELRQKNDALRESEERYHKMVSEVTDYVVISLDTTGRVLDWNKGAERIKGYHADEIVGKNFRLFYTKEDKEKKLPEKLLNEAVEKGSVTHEGWRIKKGGARYWGSVAITALHNERGEIFGFSKVTKDLTEKKIAEDKLANYADELLFSNEELKKSEERFHKMVSEVKDYAIILLDKNGIIQNWNAGAEFIKGYTAAEAVGKSFEMFYPPEDQKTRLPNKLLEEAARMGRVANEGWRVRKDGTKFWGSVVITALHDSNKAIIGFSKVTRDLTERKKAEDQSKEDAVELERKNRALERVNAEISSFAYVASHDLKEPLRKIQTFASRIPETMNKPEAVLELLGKISGTAARMQKLMEDLLTYSQLSASNGNFQKVDLNVVMDTVLRDLELSISDKNAQLKIDRLPTINGIAFQLEQLFINLLSNALKFSKIDEPPVITITSSELHGKEIPLGLSNDMKKYYKITIKDNGIGFPEEHSQKIFEVFQKVHHKRAFAGSGVGLAVVKRIMENHGGLIMAEGKPDTGATFSMFFSA
ncbi:MAG TPA: PAS domain S-box protein [Chryseolinea sp.]